MLEKVTSWVVASASVVALGAMQSDPVASMLAMMEGVYNAVDSDLVDRRVVVTAEALGEHVVYWQLNTGPEQDVYRQRLLVFDYDPERDVVVQRTWSFENPEAFVDAFEAPERFAGLTEDDVENTLPEGCDQVWRRDGDGWYGRVDPDTCRIFSERRQAWRRIGSEVRISPTEYKRAERGFDDDGNQVFGTEPGEFLRLERVAP